MDAAAARRSRRSTRNTGRPCGRVRALGAIALSATLSVAAFASAPPTAAVTRKTTSATSGPNAAEPKSWIIVDADTGKVVAGKDVHTPYHPASVSKVMTALTAVERLDPTKGVDVPANAISPGVSNLTPVGIQTGQKWPLDTMLAMLMLASANDAAYSLAMTASGSLGSFAEAETDLGRRLGLRDSTFNDPAGLDDSHSFGGGPLMSAYDIAISVRNAMHVAEIDKWAATATFDYDDPAGTHHHIVNHNRLLPGEDKAYLGANGFKTGHTTRAGNTLAATATRNNRTLIVVVLDTWDTFGWTARYFDQGFATPVAPATAEQLPAPKATSYTQRFLQRAGFLALVHSIPQSTSASTTTVTTYVRNSSTTRHSPTTRKGAALAKSSTTKPGAGTTASKSSGGGFLTLQRVVVLIVALLVVAVVLRRRVVMRRRAKRAAQRRRMQNALRRGSLPVVDGRYRAGMRTGPPVQSHVRLHRDND